MQKIMLMGYVGKDPEERVVSGGKKVTNFSIGVSSKIGGIDSTNWYNISCWGDTFSKVLSFVKKGSNLVVTGRLTTPKIYVGKDGINKINLSLICESINYVPSPKSDDKGSLPPEIEDFFKENGF